MGSVYRSMLFSRFIPPSLSPAASTSLLSTSVTLFLPSKQVHLYHFSRFYIYVFIYDMCFSLPDLLHSVRQTLRQSTAQQMTQFVTFYGWGIFLCNVPHLWVSRVVLVVKNPPADGREVKDSGSVPGSGKSSPWVRKIPWRRAWEPTWVFLPRESRGQRSLVGYGP